MNTYRMSSISTTSSFKTVFTLNTNKNLQICTQGGVNRVGRPSDPGEKNCTDYRSKLSSSSRKCLLDSSKS